MQEMHYQKKRKVNMGKITLIIIIVIIIIIIEFGY